MIKRAAYEIELFDGLMINHCLLLFYFWKHAAEYRDNPNCVQSTSFKCEMIVRVIRSNKLKTRLFACVHVHRSNYVSKPTCSSLQRKIVSHSP